jgi:hypothetical protein
MDNREGGLLRWQWSLYADGHHDRRNLALHAVTNPLFIAGSIALVSSPLAGGRVAVIGLVAMLAALVAQGRGHKLEQAAPVPFRGPADFVARFFAEQWITFPRFVLSGAFARAWRAAGGTALSG